MPSGPEGLNANTGVAASSLRGLRRYRSWLRPPRGFIAAAASLPQVRLGLVSQDPLDRLPPQVARGLDAFEHVGDGLDPRQIREAVLRLGRRIGPVERLLGALEQLQEPLGQVREELRIEGMGSAVAANFRDKSRMKDVLRAAGVPCARHRLVGNKAEARAAIQDIGLPLVAKPPAGAAAKNTYPHRRAAGSGSATGLDAASA